MAQCTVRWVDESGAVLSGGLEELERAAQGRWAWVDVTAADEATVRVIAEHYSLHPLAAEDLVHGQARPKLDLYPDGAFFVWIVPRFAREVLDEEAELDAYLSDNILLTTHNVPLPEIDQVVAEGDRVLLRGPDWVLHGILDRLVDALLGPVDAIGDALEDVEDRMLDDPDRSDLARLYSLRRQLLRLHRIVGPERDIVRELARSRTYVSEDAYRYFDDVGDHVARVEDAIETYRDVGAAVMDIYLSAQSNRMNQIMKTLTVVATIFMPLTLISGIYGMNVVEGMWPPSGAAWSFWAICAAMMAIALWMIWLFRRRDWW